MKHAFLCGILIASSLSLNAQIGLPKLPKVPKISSGTASNASNLSKVDLSPAATAIKDYRNALSFAKDAVNGKHSDAGSRLDALVGKLAKIKEQDPKWSEYDKDEADYKALRAQYDKDQEGAKWDSRLQSMYYAVQSVEREPWNGWGNVSALEPSNYKEIKAYYDSHPEQATTAFTKGALAKCAEFQPTILPKIKAEELKDIDEVMSKTADHIKANRVKADYLNNKSVGYLESSPKSDVKTLESNLGDFDVAFRMMPGDADFTQRKADIEARIADLNLYMSSGEHAQMVAKLKQMEIDKVQLFKPGMTNASYDAIVKRDLNATKYGTIQRIVLVSRDWEINKNEYGLIISKSIDVQVATKLDGKCYKVRGYIAADYAGGGTYSTSPTFVTQDKEEMNCNNISK